MKHLTVLLILSMFIFCVSAQSKRPSTVAELAQSIDARYHSPVDKLTAAYSWVTTNIRYDKTGVFAMNNSINPRDVIDRAFQNRAGVCENFSAIFSDLCKEMGFQSVVIRGTGASGSRSESHSWAAVKVNNHWYLFDPTWDIGRVQSFQYFMKTGEEFLRSHTPFDPLYQFTSGKNIPTAPSSFSATDSVEEFLAADTLLRLETAVSRVERNKKRSEAADLHLRVLKNELEIKRQEEQMVWFDKAVDKMNNAAAAINHIIDLRNERFSTVTVYDDLHKLLANAAGDLDTAAGYLDQVDGSKATLVYGTGPAREQLSRLRMKLADQKSFLNNFLLTNTRDRENMFLQK